MAIDALILDFGEVLVRPQSQSAVERMSRLARLEVDEFRERYWRHRPDYDSATISDIDYWRRVLDGVGIPHGELSEVIDGLEEADALSWTDYREEIWRMAWEFKRTRGQTAFLSNGIPGVMAKVRTDKNLADYFDVVVVSYEVGSIKPDRRIYEICLDRLGVQAKDALFVDDRVANIEGAERVGLQTLHFRGDDGIADLRSRIAPSSNRPV